MPYVLSAHETTTIHFSEKRVWSLQAQIQREKNLNFFTLSIKDAVKDKNNPLAELSQCILDSSNGSIINVI